MTQLSLVVEAAPIERALFTCPIQFKAQYFVIYKFYFVIRSLPAGQATVEMGWGYLRKQLREFTLNTQVQRFD